MSADIPVIMTAAGAVPTPPADLRAQLVAIATADDPGLTTDLPGSLVEDLASTATGALVVIDQARVDAINSLTPFGANAFTLKKLGNMYGVEQADASRTSVFVVFSGPPGYIIQQGFVVSDGTFQYATQDAGVIGSDGNTAAIFCVATIDGSWSVPSGTVIQLVTSIPTTVGVVTVVNQDPGTPGTGTETEESYRVSVLQAGLVTAVGTPAFTKTLLGQVAGVQKRLIAVRQNVNGDWEVICGGGDPYQVAYAIFKGTANPLSLAGSVISIVGITNANPGVATTDLNHGLTDGDLINITNADPGTFDVSAATATVVDEKTFTYAVDTSGFGSYTGSGVLTPNTRNIVVTLQSYPDTYQIPYVNPPEQDVTLVVTWNTTATNFVSDAAVSQLSAPALVDYINTIFVGQPINLLEMATIFQAAVAPVLPPDLLSRLVFEVSINGVGTSPDAGSSIVVGDPESYFFTELTSITVARG